MMDPDENRRELLALARRMQDELENGSDPNYVPCGFDVGRMCELVIALDEWISKGGALPKAWQR